MDETHKILIYVGRICRDKGVNELVEAFNMLNFIKENVAYKLILLGLIVIKHDKISNKVMAAIKKNKNIIHIKHRKNVYPYLHMSDLLIIPSYGEGFGNVVIEAGASGLPVLGTNVVGLNESIIANYNGIKVTPYSSDSILNGIVAVFSDKKLYRRLKINGMINVKNNFKETDIINLSVNKMLELIN